MAAEAAGVKTKGGLDRPVGGDERYTRASRPVGHRAELGDAKAGEPVGLEKNPAGPEPWVHAWRVNDRIIHVVETMPNSGHNFLQPLRAAHRAR